MEGEDWIGEVYVTSMYWTITTMSTVGYGDISGTNSSERIFCAAIMIIGVTLFSYVNGAVASLLANFDQVEVINKKNLDTLRTIRQSPDYHLDRLLYNKCVHYFEFASQEKK